MILSAVVAAERARPARGRHGVTWGARPPFAIDDDACHANSQRGIWYSRARRPI
jgi:hypothetical protein